MSGTRRFSFDGRSFLRLAILAFALVAAPLLGLIPSTAHADVTHIVRPGETLTSIAAQYGVPVEHLVLLNRIPDANHLEAGAALVVRLDRYSTSQRVWHVVRRGETLSSIAERYGTRVSDIVAANGLDDADAVFVGQALQIPAGAGQNPYGARPVENPGENPFAARYVSPGGSSEHGEPSPSVARALDAAAAEFGLDPVVIRALSLMESGWRQDAVSPAGAVGLMQIMPDTGEWLVANFVPDATEWRTSAYDNARAGAAYFAYLLELTDGDLSLALAAYYQGWGSVRSDGLYEETRQYVADVLALIYELS